MVGALLDLEPVLEVFYVHHSLPITELRDSEFLIAEFEDSLMSCVRKFVHLFGRFYFLPLKGIQQLIDWFLHLDLLCGLRSILPNVATRLMLSSRALMIKPFETPW